VKPANWPRYMREKRLKAGAIAYYWEPHTRDVARGCPVHAEALGPNYAGAIERATLLNRHLDAWRSGLEGTKVEIVRRGYGTIAWLFDTYVKSPAFERRVSKRSRYEYRRALARIEDTPTKTGGTVGDLPVSSITTAAVDKIYTKLQVGPRGHRVRQANLSIDIARRAWDVVHRLASTIVPAENPWKGVERDTTKRSKAAAHGRAPPWSCSTNLLRVATAPRARTCRRHHVGRLPSG
jgi:hypothetical protein